MIRSLKTGLALALALVAVTGAAQAFDLKGGGQVKPKPTKVQLGIISPDNCPGKGTIQVWMFSNVPGTFDILIVKKGGNVAGPYSITTVEGSGGVIMGSYKQNMMLHNAIDAEYRVVIPNSTIASNWVPLTACL